MRKVSEVEIGTRLGDRYRLTEIAGFGGMAVVYKAVDEQSGDIVAVKMLRSDVNNARADERLVHEATLGARLDHPNCVGVIDSGHLDGAPYLVMEFIDGQLLRDYLATVGALPWRSALGIAAHLLRGLAHAHDRGVLHRDIKPENIVLSSHDGDLHFARLIDFGISKLLEGAGIDPNLTGTGIIIGTPRYLSPEQAVGGAIGPATDLYALTCVLFELLTGQPPFDGGDLVQIVTAHAMTPPPDPRELRPDLGIPEAVADLVAVGLRKRPDERPANAAAYAAEVERLLAREPSPLPTESPSSLVARDPSPSRSTDAPGSTTPPAARRPLARRYWAVIALAGAVVGIVAVAVSIGTGSSAKGLPLASLPQVIAVSPPPDPELLLKANLHDLANGSTCAQRLAAVDALRRLGDKRAVPALKKARMRMRGGFLGIGGQNINQCLRAAADAAIRELDPESNRPSRARKSTGP